MKRRELASKEGERHENPPTTHAPVRTGTADAGVQESGDAEILAQAEGETAVVLARG